MIDALVEKGMNLQDVTVVGHSLGAHIAGRAAKKMKSSGKIACIIGLDPASVGYDFFEREKRLTESDADYVQVIHTDGDKFGFANPLGQGTFINFKLTHSSMGLIDLPLFFQLTFIRMEGTM